jgi:hypothetical protein
MPILVRHVPTQKLYVFLGPACALAKTNRSNLDFDVGYATFENKQVVVADKSGEISWLPAHEVVIESVDGRSCRVVLEEACSVQYRQPEAENR